MRIKSFIRKPTDHSQSFSSSSDEAVNILLFTSKGPSKSIKSIQRAMLEQFQRDIRLTQCTSEQALSQLVRKSLNQSANQTICVSDRAFDSVIEKLIKQNSSQKAFEKVKKFKGVLILDKIEGIDSRNFNLDNISLISTDIEQVKQYLRDQILGIISFRRSGSITTLNSEDQANYEKQLFNQSESIQLPKNFKKDQSKQVQVVLNDTPGVGSYNLNSNNRNNNFNMGSTFVRQTKAVNPQKWNAQQTKKGEEEWWGTPKKPKSP